MKRLWNRWLKNRMLDEFSRIDIIKGQQRGKRRNCLMAPAERRMAVDAALQQCPVGRWVCCDEFFRFMRADGHQFEIIPETWRLYILDAHYGGLENLGPGTWQVLQDRYILYLLSEYAATLGMIDIAYTRPHYARSDYCEHCG